MRWAVAQGYREDNPAGDAIGAALPKQGVRPRHLAALPYAEVAGAIATVRGSGADPAVVLAFEFLVLTACRSGEVRGARWDEMDLEGREWRIPAKRMKTSREHRVPLSTRALAVLGEAKALAGGSGLVFPSPTGKQHSRAAISKLVQQLGIGAVPHGFRSSFRDWAAECTDAPREVCELALAHVNTNAVEAAYRRSDLFERRRELMEAWAAFLSGSGTREVTVGPVNSRGVVPAGARTGRREPGRRIQAFDFRAAIPLPVRIQWASCGRGRHWAARPRTSRSLLALR